MFAFILGAIAGAAGYWAYQRYVVGSDDDAFADFETSSLDRPTTSEMPSGSPSEGAGGSGASSSTPGSTS
ncbi:MAG TPA: hypothetical protein VEQ11_02110 [Chloroflexota bacterium]|nr:hypothetical protein [Chloroflexota bacterium]